MGEATGALAAQGLDASDLDANRAGRVSQKQIARQMAVRRRGGGGVWLMAVVGLTAGGVGALRFVETAQPGGAVFMAVLGLVIGAIPLFVYYAFRFADPAKVGACKVTRIENAEVAGFLSGRNRGVYAISLGGQRYSGFAKDLTRAHLGARVNAYVVPEHRIVVALEPID